MTYQKSGEMLSLLYLGDDVINGDILIDLNRVEEVNVVFQGVNHKTLGCGCCELSAIRGELDVLDSYSKLGPSFNNLSVIQLFGAGHVSVSLVSDLPSILIQIRVDVKLMLGHAVLDILRIENLKYSIKGSILSHSKSLHEELVSQVVKTNMLRVPATNDEFTVRTDGN
jgi:hypothetical protein